MWRLRSANVGSWPTNGRDSSEKVNTSTSERPTTWSSRAAWMPDSSFRSPEPSFDPAAGGGRLTV